MKNKNSTDARPFPGARAMLVACALSGSVAVVAGCDDDLVPEPEGLRVSGRVFLEGEIPADYETPSLQVGVFAIFPPNGPPQGFTVIPFPDFTPDGIEYEIFGMPVFDRYQVVAQVNDQANPDVTGGPAGAFPDFCQLNAADGGLVSVAEQTPTTEIDITLYPAAGTTDPCFIPDEPDPETPPECPAAQGRASLVVDVTSSLDPETFTETDNLLLALFTTFPGPPATFTIVPRANLEFPLRPILNNLPPDDYIVFACYDREGNNLMNCGEGEGDVSAFYDSQNTVTAAADTITTIGVNIDTGSSVPPESQTPEDAGCPAQE